MKLIKICYTAILAQVLLSSPVFAAEDEFDADQMLLELEQQLQLSGDKLSKLKPALDAKSAELKNSINASVEKGFMELEALSGQLDSATREAEAKLKEALSGEEMQKLKDYLGKIDRDAIASIQQSLVEELEKILRLTEDQIVKLKPVLEDAFRQLSEMLERLAHEGNKTLDQFREEYKKLNTDLKQKLVETLDGEQIKSLDAHRDELRAGIGEALFSGS